MINTVKKYASKACALAAAVALCFSLALFAFSRPSMPAKADAGNYVSYYAAACDDYIAQGIAQSSGISSAFGVALGTQLMLLLIAEQCEQERASRPGATLNLTNYTGLTGFYTVDGSSGNYYPMTLCIDKNLQSNVANGQYTAMDGGLNVIKAAHFNLKFYATGYPSYVLGSVGSGGGYLQCNGTGAAVDAIPTRSTSLFSQNYASMNKSDLSIGTWFRFASNTYANYTTGASGVGDWVAFKRSTNGQVMAGYVGSYDDNVIDGLPDLEVSPDNLPLVYDTIIDDIPVPYRIFPDGFPVEEPTEETTEETTESDNDQPFTLPPEWLETYPVPEIPDPSIPYPSDAQPPTINYEIQRNGLNFWADLWTDLIDKTGLGSYVVILLGLSILEWILWHAGNGGNGKGGEQ